MGDELLCEDCEHFSEFDGWCEVEGEYVSAFTLACDRFEEIERELNEIEGELND